jgi:hypothetical protein
MFNIDNDNDHHSHRLNMALIMIMIMIINVIFQYISILWWSMPFSVSRSSQHDLKLTPAKGRNLAVSRDPTLQPEVLRQFATRCMQETKKR